jgi:hypothetical protein
VTTFRDRVGLEPGVRSELERKILSLRMLEDVVRWGYSLMPARDIADVVVQDEFSHDVLLPWEGGLYLVFDTT